MELDALATQVARLDGVYTALTHEVETRTAAVTALLHEKAVLTASDAALSTLLATVQAELQQDVERLVGYGLSAVFPDLKLGFSLVLSEKRGGPWCDALLVDGAVSAPILDAFGGGPASVVAFLLRLLTVRRTGLAPVLLLDEPFSMVSAEYVPRVATLLRELADKAGVTILMVTHDRTFLDVATVAYEAVEANGATRFQKVG